MRKRKIRKQFLLGDEEGENARRNEVVLVDDI
jgi:hypothetical protein